MAHNVREMPSSTNQYDRGPKLDHDALALLFRFMSNRKDVLNLMHTCHSLYSAGIPHLLGYPIKLEYRWPQDNAECKISSFADFVLTPDTRRRATYIQDIEISYDAGSISKQTFDKLLEVLRRATNLQAFRRWRCEEFSGAVMLEALAANESMRTLELVLHPRMIGALQKWQAPLERIHLRRYREYKDPSSILRVFSATLQEFTADRMSQFRPEPGVVFPCLKKLTLTEFYRSLPHVQDFVHAYPNLTHLSLSPDESFHTDDSVEETRQQNMEDNLLHCWDLLEAVEGSVEGIYGLGLPYQIPRLQLFRFEQGRTEHETRHSRAMLSAVLGTARPSRVWFTLSFGSSGVHRDGLRALWDSGSYHLRSKRAVQVMPIIYDYTDVFVQLCPLKYIKLTICDSKIHWYISALGDDEMPPNGPAGPPNGRPDAGIGIAFRFAQRITGLSKIELEFPWQATRSTWEIIRDAQGQKMLRCVASGNIFKVPTPG